LKTDNITSSFGLCVANAHHAFRRWRRTDHTFEPVEIRLGASTEEAASDAEILASVDLDFGALLPVVHFDDRAPGLRGGCKTIFKSTVEHIYPMIPKLSFF
jgi:hypothetical protein